MPTKLNFLYSPLKEAYNPPKGEEVKPLPLKELQEILARSIQTNQGRLFQEAAVVLIDQLVQRVDELEAAPTAPAAKAKVAPKVAEASAEA